MSNEEIVAEFEKKYDELDVNKKDKIGRDEFYKLYKQLQKKDDIPKSNSDIIFSGIDFNNEGTISKFDFINFVKSEIYCDELNQYKIIFRSFDKDRNGALTTDSVIEIGKFVNKKITKKEAETILENETGSKNGKMTFPVFYKMMTGRDTDPKTDPYDGRLKSSSLCCLLL